MELLLPTEGNMNDDRLALEFENTQASVAMELETPQSMSVPTAQKRKLQDPEKDLINVLTKHLQPPEQNTDSMFLQSQISYMANNNKMGWQVKLLQFIRLYNHPTTNLSNICFQQKIIQTFLHK